MKNIFKLKTILFSCILAVCLITAAHAQVTGPKSIPGDYADLATAITDLNTNGVGVGGATINIAGGYTETAPAGGFVLGSATLNGSLSVSNTLVFQKSGGGANPLFTAFTPGTTTNSDGIFKIAGADYVSILNIDFQENGANTTATQWMEWGISLHRASSTDGTQNTTISGCTITLNKNNFGTAGLAGSHGIYCDTVSTTFVATATSGAGGTQSNNTVKSCIISNCNTGIYFRGSGSTPDYDLNNIAGGNLVADGNLLTNWGSAATAGTLFGIYFTNNNNATAKNNTVDNASGGAGVQNGTGNVFGIAHDLSVNTIFTCTNNNVTITRASGTGTTTAIASFGGGTGSTTGTITLDNNTVRLVSTGSLTGTFTVINAANALGAATTVSVQNNIISNTNPSTTGAINLIAASNSAPTLNVSGNSTSGTCGRAISGAGQYAGIFSATTAVTTGTFTISNNNISNLTLNNTGSSFIIVCQTGLSLNNGPNVTLSGNTVSNISNTGTGAIFPINQTRGKTNVINNNSVFGITNSGGSITGIIGGDLNTFNQTISNNTVRNMTTGQTGAISLIGINAQAAATSNVFRNKVYDNGLISPSTSVLYGIYTSSATATVSTTNIYNNFIGRLTGQCGFVNGVTGIANSFTLANTTNVMNIYYNTVYLNNATGVSNCYYSASANGTLVCRNNIFVNNSTGQVYCLHRAGTSLAAILATYGAASNNNIFWPTTAAFVTFINPTVTTYSLSQHQTNASPRDNQSKTEIVPFLNTTTGASANYLHVDPAIPTQAESGAVNIATYTDDYDADIRQGNGGYVGTGTAPDIGADEGNFTILPPNDATVTQMYTLGKMAVGYTQGYQVQARVANVGALTIASVNVTLTISGVNSFSNVQAVTSLAPGASQLVTFAGFSPTVVGANTVTISVASDDNNTNNSLALPLETTSDIVSYRYATPVITSGVGFTGATGDFIAKFVSPNNFGNSDTINGFEVFFVASGLPFQVGVWGDAGGTPGALIYSTASQNTTAGTFFISLPDVPVSGTYYVGLKQTGTTNLNYGYQAENVVRTGAFFYTSPTGGVSWTDFNTGGAHFRISATVQYKTPQPPACAANLQPPNLSTVCEGNQLTWASGGGGPTGYRITLGTNSPNYNNVLNNFDLGLVTSYTLTSLTPNTTYGWQITPYNITGPAVGCGFLTFNTPATGTLNEEFTNVTFPPQCWTRQTIDWDRNVVSSNGIGAGSAWFDFYNVPAATTSDLTTPVFTAAPFNYAVNFNHAYAAYDDGAATSYLDQLEILASTNGGTSYTSVVVLDGGLTGDLNTAPETPNEFVPTAAQWGNMSIPIPTGTNRIIFRAISDFGNDLFLDSITLVALPNCVQSPIAPVDASSMCPSPSTLLSWSAFPGATGYNVYLDAALVSTNQAGTTYNTGALSVGPHTWSIIPQLVSGTAPSCTDWTFTVNAPPTPDATSNSPVCEGLSLNLFGDNVAVGQSVGNTWSWSGPSFTSASQNPTVTATATVANSGTYTLTVTNSNGCTASASSSVTVNPNPVLVIGSQTNVSCNGESDGEVDLDATSGTSPFIFDLDGNPTLDGIYTGLAAGPYTANVIDDNGCEAASIIVTITEPAVLTVSAGSNTPVCTGTSLNLTSTPVGGTIAYGYAWTGPNGPVPAVQNPIINPATAADAGQYDLTVTDANGCTATASHTVIVNTSPTATISNFGNNNICLSQPATVTLTFTGTGPWTYTVSDGTQNVSGSTPSSPVNINITPVTTGTHIYTITSVGNASCPAAGTGTGSATVFVSSAPPGVVTGTFTGPSYACSGTVSLIIVNPISGQNINYSWNTGSNSSVVLFSTNIGGPFSAGPFSTPTNQVYAQFGPLGAGHSGYYVCVQGTNGCGSTINRCLSIRGTVSGPGPIAPADPLACPNDVKNYTCGASTGATVYSWTLGGSATPITSGQGTTAVIVTFPPAFTTGQLCVTAALACGGSSTSPPRCMTISNTPAVPGTITGPSKVCPGATGVAFSVPLITGATGYNWTVPSGATIATGTGSNAITVNFPTPYTGAPSICVTATGACATSAPRCKTVGTNIPAVPGNITGPNSNICNSTVQYSIANVAGATDYTWTGPAGTTVSNGQGTTTILLAVSPTFTTGNLSVTANTSLCTPGSSAPRTIAITGKPSTPGTITAGPLTWCAGGFVNFSVVSAAPLPTYTWFVANGTIDAGQGSNNIDVTWGSGAGNVNVTASNGCGASGTRSQSFSSSCREEEEELSITDNFAVYPNPAHDNVTVSIYVKEAVQFNIKLRDLSGRIILSEDRNGSAGLNTYDMELKNFAKGLYMLEVQSADRSWKSKVVID